MSVLKIACLAAVAACTSAVEITSDDISLLSIPDFTASYTGDFVPLNIYVPMGGCIRKSEELGGIIARLVNNVGTTVNLQDNDVAYMSLYRDNFQKDKLLEIKTALNGVALPGSCNVDMDFVADLHDSVVDHGAFWLPKPATPSEARSPQCLSDLANAVTKAVYQYTVFAGSANGKEPVVRYDGHAFGPRTGADFHPRVLLQAIDRSVGKKTRSDFKKAVKHIKEVVCRVGVVEFDAVVTKEDGIVYKNSQMLTASNPYPVNN